MWITFCFNGSDDPLNQWLDAHCNNTYKKIEHVCVQKSTSITSSTTNMHLTFQVNEMLERKSFFVSQIELNAQFWFEFTFLVCHVKIVQAWFEYQSFGFEIASWFISLHNLLSLKIIIVYRYVKRDISIRLVLVLSWSGTIISYGITIFPTCFCLFLKKPIMKCEF